MYSGKMRAPLLSTLFPEYFRKVLKLPSKSLSKLRGYRLLVVVLSQQFPSIIRHDHHVSKRFIYWTGIYGQMHFFATKYCERMCVFYGVSFLFFSFPPNIIRSLVILHTYLLLEDLLFWQVVYSFVVTQLVLRPFKYVNVYCSLSVQGVAKFFVKVIHGVFPNRNYTILILMF